MSCSLRAIITWASLSFPFLPFLPHHPSILPVPDRVAHRWPFPRPLSAVGQLSLGEHPPPRDGQPQAGTASSRPLCFVSISARVILALPAPREYGTKRHAGACVCLCVVAWVGRDLGWVPDWLWCALPRQRLDRAGSAACLLCRAASSTRARRPSVLVCSILLLGGGGSRRGSTSKAAATVLASWQQHRVMGSWPTVPVGDREETLTLSCFFSLHPSWRWRIRLIAPMCALP